MLKLICDTSEMGFAAIARVTADRWIACSSHDTISFGVQTGDELKVDTTLCTVVQKTNAPLAIDHAEEDAVYRTHPFFTTYGFQSSVSVPVLRQNGEFFGTLCAFDPKPANVNNEKILGIFRMFADLISFHLEALEKKGDQKFSTQKSTELQEEFIGVLSHDLKNPVATARMSAEILLKLSQNEMFTRHANMIKATTYRMEDMIENITDYASTQIGTGISLKLESNKELLQKKLLQKLRERQIISPHLKIESSILLEESVSCDINRIGQMCSSIIEFVDRKIKGDSTLRVKAISKDQKFVIAVSATGFGLSAQTLENLFEPYYREEETEQIKSGIDLFIASEIAKAHRGVIEVTANENEICFRFKMVTQ